MYLFRVYCVSTSWLCSHRGVVGRLRHRSGRRSRGRATRAGVPVASPKNPVPPPLSLRSLDPFHPILTLDVEVDPLYWLDSPSLSRGVGLQLQLLLLGVEVSPSDLLLYLDLPLRKVPALFDLWRLIGSSLSLR